jgi:hypothetical protein
MSGNDPNTHLSTTQLCTIRLNAETGFWSDYQLPYEKCHIQAPAADHQVHNLKHSDVARQCA